MMTDAAMHAWILSNPGAWSLDPDVATKVGVAEPIVASTAKGATATRML